MLQKLGGALVFDSKKDETPYNDSIMEGSMKCVKYMLFGFNLIFAISGLALIVTGGVVQGLYSQYLDFLGDNFLNTPVLLIIVGCVIFFVTFFGCCGAIKENHCMTITFSVLLALIFIVELGAGIAAYMMRSEVRNIIEVNMEKGLKNFEVAGHDGVTKTWNSVQHELHCCGAQEFRDWENTTFSKVGDSVPDSCCLSDVSGCGTGVLKMDDGMVPKIIYTKGCLDTFQELITSNVAAIGGVGVGIAFIQFIGMVFACCLAKSIKKEYETV